MATPARTPGSSCPFWLELHPFLAHYQTTTATALRTRRAPPATGGRRAGRATATSSGPSTSRRYAGSDVEVSISYASDDIVQATGVFVDDVVVSTGEGSTSFEDDGDPLDGWTVPGSPPGSGRNPNDWIVGTAADAPPTAR